MKHFSMLVLAALACVSPTVSAQDKTLDWVKVTDHAGWKPRDSQGELVYKNQLWIFGGWFQSFEAPPRDVWNSPDGKTWKQVTKEAPWKHSDLPMTLVHNGKMWMMGGWYNGRLKGHSASNEVWFSTDGAKWDQAAANAAWSPRAYHQAVVHAGKIWIFGGGNYVPEYHALNDVWCSGDGVQWTEVTVKAPWSPRLWFSAVTYRDRMWVLGGWSNNPWKNWGDVWHSRDGKNWQELQSTVCWKARHEHSAFVFQDKIWIAGGHAQPLSSEVWSLDVPKGWFPKE